MYYCQFFKLMNAEFWKVTWSESDIWVTRVALKFNDSSSLWQSIHWNPGDNGQFIRDDWYLKILIVMVMESFNQTIATWTSSRW